MWDHRIVSGVDFSPYTWEMDVVHRSTMLGHERPPDTDLETAKALGWCLCKETLTALESVDGTSTAKMHSIMKSQEGVQLLE